MGEFLSPSEFARTIERACIRMEATQLAAMEASTELLKKAAQSQFGHYDDNAPEPFHDWPELADSTKKDRVRLGFTENDPLLRTGELRGSIKSEATPREGIVGSDSDIMVYQEMGTETIPPRPVLGPVAIKYAPTIAKFFGESVIATIASKPILRLKDLSDV